MADKIPDPTQEALFREVDEDLRHEQMTRLWKAYGNWLITAAVLIVAVVAGYQGWQAWERSNRAAEALAFEQAIAGAADTPRQAADALAAMADGASTGYASVARLDRAALLLETGARDDALATLQALAGDGRADPVIRDMARVLWGLAALEGSEDPAAVASFVAPLVAPGNAFQASAMEVQALAALQAGDTDKAVALYQDLSQLATAPAGLRERAGELLAALGQTPEAAEPAQAQ